LRTQFTDCLLVIAPRHPERFESVAALCRLPHSAGNVAITP